MTAPVTARDVLAAIRELHRPIYVPAIPGYDTLRAFTRCSCTPGLLYADCPTAAELDRLAVPPDDWPRRLHAHIEDRRRHLGLTLAGIQAAGGPSDRWVQNLRHLEGPPTDRMRSPMRRLDGALE